MSEPTAEPQPGDDDYRVPHTDDGLAAAAALMPVVEERPHASTPAEPADGVRSHSHLDLPDEPTGPDA